MRLLLIEDDPILGEGLRDFLRADGHRVDWCNCLAATDALRGEPYDAWLVDWQLPDGSGLEWARTRRARGEITPVLMLTAQRVGRSQALAPVHAMAIGAQEVAQAFAQDGVVFDQQQSHGTSVAVQTVAPTNFSLASAWLQVDFRPGRCNTGHV